MKSIKELKKDIERISKQYTDFEKNTPRLIAIIAKKWVDDNFENEGLEETKGNYKAWKERSPTTQEIYRESVKRKEHGFKGSVFNADNPLLLQTGNLRKSIKSSITGRIIFIGCNLNNVSYAKLMNEGGRIPFGNQLVYVPARPFLKYTPALDLRIKEKITEMRSNILKPIQC